MAVSVAVRVAVSDPHRAARSLVGGGMVRVRGRCRGRVTVRVRVRV